MALLVLGFVLGGLSLPVAWSQAARVVRRGSCEGLSPAYVVLLLWSGAAWGVHGALQGNLTQLVLEAAYGAAGVVITRVQVRTGAATASVVLGPSALYGVLLVGAGLEHRRAAVGVAALVLAVVCRAPQVWESVRRPGGAAVSVASFAVGALTDLLWVANGLLVGDPLTVVVSGVCAAAGALIAVRTSTARRRLRVGRSGLPKALPPSLALTGAGSGSAPQRGAA